MPRVPQEIKEAQERARKLGVPFVDLTGKIVPTEALKEISEEAASFYQFVPVVKKGNVLEVGMLNPEDLKSLEAVKFIAQNRDFVPKIFLVTQTDFENVLKQYRTLKEEVETALTELERELAVKEKPGGEERRTSTEAMLERVGTEDESAHDAGGLSGDGDGIRRSGPTRGAEPVGVLAEVDALGLEIAACTQGCGDDDQGAGLGIGGRMMVLQGNPQVVADIIQFSGFKVPGPPGQLHRTAERNLGRR